ncbi:MAG: DUF2147 domain-containing protein [Porphyrobacter sp.]|nr:DUF2147 domain-containing protein [Porphyrobacter sp.]
MRAVIVCFTSLLVLGGAAAAAETPAKPSALGVWINPAQTVKVETSSCGASLCGAVVWATPDARAAAKKAGTDPLIGVQLLRKYRRTASGGWQGEVFVPDMKRVFFSRIEQSGRDKLKISGCILRGLICRSQTWTRV